MPGDLDSGGAYLCEDVAEEKGSGLVDVGLDGDVVACCDWVFSELAFVVIVLEVEVALAVVVETCAVDTRDVGEITLDLAWYVGLVLALKAEKKFVKNGLLVGILISYNQALFVTLRGIYFDARLDDAGPRRWVEMEPHNSSPTGVKVKCSSVRVSYDGEKVRGRRGCGCLNFANRRQAGGSKWVVCSCFWGIRGLKRVECRWCQVCTGGSEEEGDLSWSPPAFHRAKPSSCHKSGAHLIACA